MKKAFTMIELVFVIVVIGIISAVVIPRMDRDVISEATTQLASHIRYTQHLAMVDDKFDPAAQFWYRQRWQINCTAASLCTIYSDNDMNSSASQNEIARDPLNQNGFMTGDDTLLTADTPYLKTMDYLSKYNATIASTCGNFLSFDHLGRPYSGAPVGFNASTDGLLQNDCNITVTQDADVGRITIVRETGYVQVSFD